MNREDFQKLAELRVEDAEALIAAGRWDAAYYLAGYAVECALKAAIARRTKEFDFPDKEAANKVWTHDVEKLLNWLQVAAPNDSTVAARNWELVRKWSEQSRYERWPEVEARGLLQAVTDPNDGVLQWIRKFW